MEDAKKMLQKGYPIVDIAEITGLSEEQIKKLT
ncbi:helix-turn-helix domain-containing protein [Salinispira pacifica]